MIDVLQLLVVTCRSAVVVSNFLLFSVNLSICRAKCCHIKNYNTGESPSSHEISNVHDDENQADK